MKIIFLDIDGVLNSTHSYPFDQEAFENLKSLVLKTNSKIVISSTLRKSEFGRNMILKELKKYDLDNCLIGYTHILNNREEEIKKYLENAEYTSFVILDDKDSFNELLPYFVKVDRNVGLSYIDMIKAVEILNRSDIDMNKNRN